MFSKTAKCSRTATTSTGQSMAGQCSCEAWCGWAPGYDENCYQALHCCACDECIERGVKPPKWWDPNSNYGDKRL